MSLKNPNFAIFGGIFDKFSNIYGSVVKGVIWFGCAARNSDLELALIFGSHMLNIGNIQTQNALLILLFLELNYEMVYSSMTV